METNPTMVLTLFVDLRHEDDNGVRGSLVALGAVRLLPP